MEELSEILKNIEYDYNRALDTYKNVRMEGPFFVNYFNKLLTKTKKLERFSLSSDETKQVKTLVKKIKRTLDKIINKETDIVK